MKQSTKVLAIRSFFLMLFFGIFQLALLAQDNSGNNTGEKESTTTTTSKTEITLTDTASNDWYTSPWVWVIGAAVFILLLVALLSNRGGDRSVASTTDRVTVKKSVERDTDSSL